MTLASRKDGSQVVRPVYTKDEEQVEFWLVQERLGANWSARNRSDGSRLALCTTELMKAQEIAVEHLTTPEMRAQIMRNSYE